MKYTSYSVLLVLVLLLQACNFFKVTKSEGEPVLRIADKFLYKKEINKAMPFNMSSSDSILFAKKYIDSWVKKQLLLEKAKINATIDQEELNQLVQKYREDLLINSYQQAVISEYLDETITDHHIQEYYDQNKENFKLNEELVQLRYVKFSKTVVNKKKFIELFKSAKEEDLDSLKSKEYAFKEFHFKDSSWLTYSDVMHKIPIMLSFAKKDFLKTNHFLQKEDSLNLYLIKIKNIRGKAELAPKDFVKEKIKELILHERKKALLHDMENKIMDDAKAKKQIEIIEN